MSDLGGGLLRVTNQRLLLTLAEAVVRTEGSVGGRSVGEQEAEALP